MPEDANEDDELELDFSKVTKFFKGKKKHKKEQSKEEKEEGLLEEKKEEESIKAERKEGKKEDKREDEEDEVEPEREEEKEKKDDDEISFDLSKLKTFFKRPFKHGRKEHAKKEEKGDEEFAFDMAAAAKFLKKYGIFLLILIPLFYTIAVRMPSASASYTDDWAKTSVDNYYRSQIEAQVSQQYPNLPSSNKAALVSDQFQQFLKENKDQVSQQIEGTSQYFKSFFQDPEGKPYMPDIDPYYWYRYANNILEHGYPGDIKKEVNGVESDWDNHQLAPTGRKILMTDMFHSYFLAYFYKFMHAFNPALNLMQSMMYYPVFISVLVVVFVYLIARRVSGDFGGFFAALMCGVNLAFLNRTIFGHADSDAWVIFFPVLITWLFLEAFSSKNRKLILLFSGLSGIFVGIYSLAWGGWWYIFDFLLASLGLYGIYYLILHRDELFSKPLSILKRPELQNLILIALTFFVVSGIFVTLFVGSRSFFMSPISYLGFTQIKAPVLSAPWPNVLTTVAELNEGSVDSIIGNLGGLFLFYIGLIGIAISMTSRKINTKDAIFLCLSLIWFGMALWLRNYGLFLFFALLSIPVIARCVWSFMEKDTEINIKYAILLFIWFIGTFYASTKGIRFSLLLVPAFSIAFGIALGRMLQQLSDFVSREFHIDKLIIGSVMFVLFLMPVFVMPVPGSDTSPCPWYLGAAFGSQGMACTSYKVSNRDVPIINDAWYNALKEIQKNSEENAIITSWWDFGHHFKALADRPVTFDGTTQDLPQAHWVGKSLLTDNEDQAIGILRMLDCGGYESYNELKKIKNDSLEPIEILYAIIVMDEDHARTALTRDYGLTNEQAQNILEYTHCSPPQGFYITSSDMIGKSGVWAHFGSWDFTRADIWYTTQGMDKQSSLDYMMQMHNYSQEKAEQTYYEIQALADEKEANTWIAGWPGYSSELDSCNVAGSIVTCANGLEVNLDGMDAYFPNTQQGLVKPVSLVYATKDGVFEKQLNGSVPYSVALVPIGESYKSILMSPELADSMFTRLFFFEGHGLRHFKLLTHQKSIVQEDIYVWSINWTGSEPNVMPAFVEKDTVADGDSVEVYYIGYFENNTVFDSSIQNWQDLNITPESDFDAFTNSPLPFTLGQNQVIPGFEQAIIGVKLGKEKTAEIPPEKAYGTDPEAHPLGNKTLFFKIRVVGIK